MASRRSSEEIRTHLHDRLDALLDGSDQVMDNAAYGQTVHDLDDFLIDAGRKLLQEIYEQKLQDRINHTETDVAVQECPQCKKKLTTRTQSRKP